MEKGLKIEGGDKLGKTIILPKLLSCAGNSQAFQ